MRDHASGRGISNTFWLTFFPITNTYGYSYAYT